MPDTKQIEDKTTARLLKLSDSFPDICAEQITADTIRLTPLDDKLGIFVDYFHVENVQNGNDAWRYFLSHQTDKTPHAGQFSHPTEKGCWIMAQKYFKENGCIPIPSDNTHLSEIDRDRTASAQINRDKRKDKPQVGDIVIDLQGNERRICSNRSNSFQLTTWIERDYYTDTDGEARFSGALGQSVSRETLVPRADIRRVLFWTFKDGKSGAGRRAEFWMNVPIWTYSGDLGPSMWGEVQ